MSKANNPTCALLLLSEDEETFCEFCYPQLCLNPWEICWVFPDLNFVKNLLPSNQMVSQKQGKRNVFNWSDRWEPKTAGRLPVWSESCVGLPAGKHWTLWSWSCVVVRFSSLQSPYSQIPKNYCIKFLHVQITLYLSLNQVHSLFWRIFWLFLVCTLKIECNRISTSESFLYVFF
jgi:hypothetical protein